MGTDKEERPHQNVCCRTGDETGGIRLGGSEGPVKICCYPTCMTGGRGLWDSRQCLLGVLAGIKEGLVERKFGQTELCSSLETGV